MTETGEIFEEYLGAPVTSQCYKELSQKIQQYSQTEREVLFASFHPKELHHQLLKLTAARTSRYHRPLLDGLKEECKFVSEFCLNSTLLFNGSNTELFDPNSLLPLLQTVSASTRNRILWRLGKYVSIEGNSKVSVADIDALYSAVSKVWGSNIAAPLLCQTSKELQERELPNVTNLSTGHLLVIAKKFPFLALSFLEQNPCTVHPLKAARYIVSKTIPKSLHYTVKQDSSFLTKSMTKNILKNHYDVVLESPSAWSQVLKERAVKKFLTPEHFELFLTKQFLELDDMYVPYSFLTYFKLLSPSEVSFILNKVFPEKYGCSLRSKLDFWQKNEDLLKLLDSSDRSSIAVELNTKDPLSNWWVPLMTTDLSIPRIKKLLSTEQDARARAAHMSRLVDTALLNNDQGAIEDVCKLVVDRYRNDKPTLSLFFNTDIKFSSLSAETFDLVFAAANRFYNPDDWQTQGAAKLFLIGIKRNWGESGLKEFLGHLMIDTPYFLISDLDDLEIELREICVNFLFTSSNIEDEDKFQKLALFLPLITNWNSTSLPLINDNVKMYVLALLKSKSQTDWCVANQFVCANLKSLNLAFIEDCFQRVPEPLVMVHLLLKKSLVVSRDKTLKRITEHMLDFGVNDFSAVLKKLKKVGSTEILQFLAIECKKVLADKTQTKRVQNCIILLSLTCHVNEFFSVVDPLLPITGNNELDAKNAGGDSTNNEKYCPFKASKQDDAICYGFGKSIIHLGIPALAIERMQRFCVNGDLMLFVRDALYSVCCSLPNDKAKALLLSLMKQPVSVKKHALRLLWRTVCNIETQQVLLLKFMETEKHLTIRTILMTTAIASLNICRHVSMWQVVKEMMNKLTPDDAAIVKEMVARRVPDQFLEEYFQILLEKCKILNDLDTTCLISTVANQILDYVTVISEKFVEHLIVEFFLSKLFVGVMHNHSSISDIFLDYLQGTPASNLPINKCLGLQVYVVEPRRTLEGRQQFLKERLDACAIDSPCDVFDSEQGVYLVERLLTTFIERFCESCLHRPTGTDSKKSYEYQLTEYIDFLLAYLDQFNGYSVFLYYIMLSSTKTLKMNSLESAYVVGEKFGELCDSIFLKSSASLFCYPNVMAHFFSIVNRHPLFNNGQKLDMYRGMLATVPPECGTQNSPEDLRNMLRLMTVAHILPSDWLEDEAYKEFRQTFLVLIKNTPAHVFVFNFK